MDIERGGPALEVGEEDVLVARSFNEEDYVLDTIAQYPNDPTLGKLTFMIDLKNQQKDQNVADFNGVGKSKLTMSLGYKDGNYPSESQVPIYTSQDVTAKYAVKLRLKGELLVSGDEWMIDYVYAQLASLFQPYPPANFPRKSLCAKGGMKWGLSIRSEEPVLSISLMIVPTSLLVNYTSIYLSIWPVRSGKTESDCGLIKSLTLNCTSRVKKCK